MKRNRKIYCMLLVFSLLMTLAACGGSQDAGKDDTSSASQVGSSDTGTAGESGTADESTSDTGSGGDGTSAAVDDGFDDPVDESGTDTPSESGQPAASETAPEGTKAAEPESTEPPKVEFNEEAFASLQNKNLSVIHYVSQDEYKKLASEGKTDVIWSTAADFEKKYGGKVRVTVVPFGNLVTKTISLQNANAAPDLLFASDQTFPSTAATKMLQAMEELKDGTGKSVDFQKGLWNEAVMAAFKFNGKTYAVSGKNSMPQLSLLYYNESLFKKEKLTLPKQLYQQGKWTWDEFAKAGSKLTKDTNGDGDYDQLGFATWTLIPSLFALSNDTAVVKLDSSGKYLANFKDPKILNTLNFLYDAFQSPDKGGYMSISAGLSFESDFPQGKVAMVYGNPPPDTVKFDWDAVPFPVGPDNKSNKLVAQIFGYGIPTGAKNPEGALAFLYMMNDPKYINPMKESTVKSLSGLTGGKPDASKGEWNYNNYRNPFGSAKSLKFNVAMDRNFSDVFTVYWNICDELSKGDKAATIAEKYQRIVQSYLDKSYGGAN